MSSASRLAATGEQQVATPREPGPNATGYYCRMTLNEHKGPKGQILPKGWKDPLWFSSVRDALTYSGAGHRQRSRNCGLLGQRYGAGDAGNTLSPGLGSKRKPRWYVVGSSKTSGMGGSEAVPFKELAAAQAFAKEHGGRIVDYVEARRSVTSDPPAGENSQTEGGT